jgi:hypothetical protein
MKTILLHLPVCLLLCFAGCDSETPVPRFAGTIVSHVDSYGSGTGTSHQLSTTGGMHTGFEYTDTSKTNWTADINWSFLRRESGADVYRVEWEFKTNSGSSSAKVAELSFDGVTPAKLAINEQLIISIEPEDSSDEA